jgi:WD repeat-containing protein 23
LPGVSLLTDTASAWNGINANCGTCTVHSFNEYGDDDEGDIVMGRSVDEELNPNPALFRSV